VTDNVCCLVKIIQKDERIIAAVQFEIKLFDFFSTGLTGSLIIFIRTYSVNYRNALDRLCVRMNIILCVGSFIAEVYKWRSKGQVLWAVNSLSWWRLCGPVFCFTPGEQTHI